MKSFFILSCCIFSPLCFYEPSTSSADYDKRDYGTEDEIWHLPEAIFQVPEAHYRSVNKAND